MRPVTDACEASRTNSSTSFLTVTWVRNCWNTFSPDNCPNSIPRVCRNQRQGGETTYQDGVQIPVGKGANVTLPILATRKNGKQFAIALSGPLTPGHPA